MNIIRPDPEPTTDDSSLRDLWEKLPTGWRKNVRLENNAWVDNSDSNTRIIDQATHLEIEGPVLYALIWNAVDKKEWQRITIEGDPVFRKQLGIYLAENQIALADTDLRWSYLISISLKLLSLILYIVLSGLIILGILLNVVPWGLSSLINAIVTLSVIVVLVYFAQRWIRGDPLF